MLNPNTEPRLVINADKRTITVPEELKNIAVTHDHNAETVWFESPTSFDGYDWDGLTFKVNCEDADGNFVSYELNKSEIDSSSLENGLLVPWLIDNTCTWKAGTIRFAFVVELNEEDSSDETIINNMYRWSTMPAQFTILQGMDGDTSDPVLAISAATAEALISKINELLTKVEDERRNYETVIAATSAVSSNYANVTQAINDITDRLDAHGL